MGWDFAAQLALVSQNVIGSSPESRTEAKRNYGMFGDAMAVGFCGSRIRGPEWQGDLVESASWKGLGVLA